MAAPPRKLHLIAEQRRALQRLASSPFGTTEAIMLAHGFTRRTRSRQSCVTSTISLGGSA